MRMVFKIFEISWHIHSPWFSWLKWLIFVFLSFLFFFRVWVILRSNCTLYQNNISYFESSSAMLREFSDAISLFALTSWKFELSVKKKKLLGQILSILGKNEILNQLFWKNHIKVRLIYKTRSNSCHVKRALSIKIPEESHGKALVKCPRSDAQ